MVDVLRKDIMRLMMTEHINAKGLDAPVNYAPTLEVRKGQCTVSKRLEKYGWWKCHLSSTHISLKNACTYYR